MLFSGVICSGSCCRFGFCVSISRMFVFVRSFFYISIGISISDFFLGVIVMFGFVGGGCCGGGGGGFLNIVFGLCYGVSCVVMIGGV